MLQSLEENKIGNVLLFRVSGVGLGLKGSVMQIKWGSVSRRSSGTYNIVDLKRADPISYAEIIC